MLVPTGLGPLAAHWVNAKGQLQDLQQSMDAAGQVVAQPRILVE